MPAENIRISFWSAALSKNKNNNTNIKPVSSQSIAKHSTRVVSLTDTPAVVPSSVVLSEVLQKLPRQPSVFETISGRHLIRKIDRLCHLNSQ